MKALHYLPAIGLALMYLPAAPSTAQDPQPQPVAVRPIVTGGDGVNILALRADGTSLSLDDKIAATVKDWKGLIAVDSGYYHVIGLKRDGTCVSAFHTPGMKEGASYAPADVSSWKDIVAVSGGHRHSAGLRADGTVVTAGANLVDAKKIGQWTDIVAISAGAGFTVGVRRNGTCVAVGTNEQGQCEVSEWKDIVTVATGGNHTIGLKADGKVVATVCKPTTPVQREVNERAPVKVDGWTNVIDIDGSNWHFVGLRADGTILYVCKYIPQGEIRWTDIVAIGCGETTVFGMKPDGSVVATGMYINKTTTPIIGRWKLGEASMLKAPRVPKGRSYKEPWPPAGWKGTAAQAP